MGDAMTTPPLRRVAVVGSGIAGLACAWQLRHEAQVVLFEADGHFGGHAHTVDLTLDGHRHGVDTGFLVFNHSTYPLLTALFEELGVQTAPSEMSFSVQAPGAGLEWSGSDLNGVFAQRRNLVRPAFLRMLAELARFNRLTTALADALSAEDGLRQGGALSGDAAQHGLAVPIGDFLDEHGFSQTFRDWYLLPMLGCIWSCPTEQMLRFPTETMIRFCHNHGLIRIRNRPQWHTVVGGSRRYVQAIIQALPDARLNTPVLALRRVPPDSGQGGVWLSTRQGTERFDDVVLACHTDQSLRLLGEAATAPERQVLASIRYQANRAVLHTDTALLPRRQRAWAAWNYERGAEHHRAQASVCLHYLINRLQPLPWQKPVVVSLNPAREPHARQVRGEFHYAHPVFDRAAIDAQAQLPHIQGRSHLWFAGAWTRYGFHEDGLLSATRVVQAMRQQWQWQQAQALRSAA